MPVVGLVIGRLCRFCNNTWTYVFCMVWISLIPSNEVVVHRGGLKHCLNYNASAMFAQKVTLGDFSIKDGSSTCWFTRSSIKHTVSGLVLESSLDILHLYVIALDNQSIIFFLVQHGFKSYLNTFGPNQNSIHSNCQVQAKIEICIIHGNYLNTLLFHQICYLWLYDKVTKRRTFYDIRTNWILFNISCNIIWCTSHSFPHFRKDAFPEHGVRLVMGPTRVMKLSENCQTSMSEVPLDGAWYGLQQHQPRYTADRHAILQPITSLWWNGSFYLRSHPFRNGSMTEVLEISSSGMVSDPGI